MKTHGIGECDIISVSVSVSNGGYQQHDRDRGGGGRSIIPVSVSISGVHSATTTLAGGSVVRVGGYIK